MTSANGNAALVSHIARFTIPAAMSWLPATMDSPAARAQLIAIGLQETKFEARVQGGDGPAHGLLQFERNGACAEILDDRRINLYSLPVLDMLRIPATRASLHEAVTYHDDLMMFCGRLILWIDPWNMPASDDAAKGWTIYARRWRPGRPHRETWDANFAAAWRVVKGDEGSYA